MQQIKNMLIHIRSFVNPHAYLSITINDDRLIWLAGNFDEYIWIV